MNKSLIVFFFISFNLILFPRVYISSPSFMPQVADIPIQEQWYNEGIIHFYGDGSQFEMNLSINYFFNNTFLKTENEKFLILNRVGTTYNLTMTGCFLSDLIEKTGILSENATHIQFEGKDGYRTFPLPVRILEIYPDMAYIITHEDGLLIPSYPEEGPLKSAVKLEAIQGDPEMEAIFQQNCAPGEDFVHNSKYLVKNLCSIKIICHVPFNITTTDTESSITSSDSKINPLMQIDGFQIEHLYYFLGITVILCISRIIKKRSGVNGKFYV